MNDSLTCASFRSQCGATHQFRFSVCVFEACVCFGRSDKAENEQRWQYVSAPLWDSFPPFHLAMAMWACAGICELDVAPGDTIVRTRVITKSSPRGRRLRRRWSGCGKEAALGVTKTPLSSGANTSIRQQEPCKDALRACSDLVRTSRIVSQCNRARASWRRPSVEFAEDLCVRRVSQMLPAKGINISAES